MESLEYQNVRFVPSIHQRIAFAEEVRRAADEFKPCLIAVELPPPLESLIVRGVLRLPQISAVCYHPALGGGELRYVPIDPSDSTIEGVRQAIDREIDMEFLDVLPAPPHLAPLDLPDDLTVERAGLARYVEAVLPRLPPAAPPGSRAAERETERERAMARRLARAAQDHARVLCVLGLAHYAGVLRHLRELLDDGAVQQEFEEAAPIPGAFLTHLNPESLRAQFREVPAVVYYRELARLAARGRADGRFRKLGALRRVFKKAEARYRVRSKSEINLTQYKALFQFTRNLAFAQGRLQPDTHDLIVGAKDTIDGDFGYQVYELARAYPLQRSEDSLPRLTIENNRGTLSDRDRKYRMASLFGEGDAMDKVTLRFRRRPPAESMAVWKEEWGELDRRGICSWPPEDELQERFMTFVRKRALELLTEDKKQVVEFTTSILDGLDIRETMRNWHTGKIFVRHKPQPSGRVGAVVMIFDDSARDRLYPWRTTLYAENQNESDIAIYATPTGRDVVGPRISRTEFGGILSIYPALGIPDIWHFPGVEHLTSCAEILLAGAIIFSPDRFIAYAAAEPPASSMRNLAAHYKRKIVYLPIHGFAEKQIKKIRKFHILGGHDVRDYAADYIFDE